MIIRAYRYFSRCKHPILLLIFHTLRLKTMNRPRQAGKFDAQIQTAHRNHLNGNITEAEQIYEQLLRYLPANPAIFTGLGTISLQKGKSLQAVEYLGRSLRALPGQVHALGNRGVALTAYSDENRQRFRSVTASSQSFCPIY